MFHRDLQSMLVLYASSFPAIFLTGPRQSGKTTLLKASFPAYRYVSLEDPNTMSLMQYDPIGFLGDTSQYWIIDEAQQFPELFRYIQGLVDAAPVKGRFILSGSQNFLLSSQISQSLAGRVGVLELLPLGVSEWLSGQVSVSDRSAPDLWPYLFQGQYPRPYHENIEHHHWLGSYIQTYVERDVRSLLQVKNLAVFQTFLMFCAARHGQLLNLQSIAQDSGISQTTATEWLSVLEASYIVFRTKPYAHNINKRLVKTPKLYFYDSGLVCYLLGITSPQSLQFHAQRGAIFEGFLMAEVYKYLRHHVRRRHVYFWRDSQGLEVDILILTDTEVIAIECKSSATVTATMVRPMIKWQSLFLDRPSRSFLVHTGEVASPVQIHGTTIVDWRTFLQILPTLGV